MKTVLVAIVSGLLFGIGLSVSDMVNPARVLAFLTVGRGWDPTLAFVMTGALAVAGAGWLLKSKLSRPLAADAFHVPAKGAIDKRLVFGAIVFGVGWGLVGLCPGPALADLALAPLTTGIFTLALITGIALFHFSFEKWVAAVRAPHTGEDA